jgi:hypothetical protein
MGPKDMAANHTHPRPPAPPPLNHELSDADPAPILKFLAFLVAASIVIALLVVPFYNYLERREAAEKTARHPMSLTGVERPLPPPPRLQTYPFQDIKALRQHDKPVVGSYEWVDRNAGTVRIPVDRAMDLLAQRGLPYRKGGQPSAAGAAGAGSSVPGGAGVAQGTSGASAASSGSEAMRHEGSRLQAPGSRRPPGTDLGDVTGSKTVRRPLAGKQPAAGSTGIDT